MRTLPRSRPRDQESSRIPLREAQLVCSWRVRHWSNAVSAVSVSERLHDGSGDALASKTLKRFAEGSRKPLIRRKVVPESHPQVEEYCRISSTEAAARALASSRAGSGDTTISAPFSSLPARR
jgi:hypothetical protein